MLLRCAVVLASFSLLLTAQSPVPVPIGAEHAPLPPDLARAIAKEGIDNSQVMRLLRDLTGKIGHRLTGSDNFTKACEWAKDEFERMGLEVELEKWGEWRLAWNRGVWSGRITQPIQLDMYVATEAWTAGTNGRQRGIVIEMPKSENDQPLPEGALADKWIIARRKPGAGVRQAAQAAGALGVVYRAGDPDRDFPTRVRVFGNHQTAMRPLAEAPTFPEIAVQADHFDQLWQLVADGKPVECEFEIGNSFREGPIELHNVIATLPGSEKPDECVVISAHLDSWHQVTGTTDNGTGTATTMEAARILTAIRQQPKRSIKFCLWGGEEQGLLGSRAHVQRHRSLMPKVSACFNHDTGTNWAHSLSVTQAMHDQLAPIFAEVNRLLKAPDPDFEGDVFKLNIVQRVSGGGGSDHASFIAAGVPGLNWNLRGRSNYFAHTWHTQWDTIDVAIEEYQRHTATVVAMAAFGTANLPELLDRTGVSAGGGRPQSAAFAASWFGAEMEEFTFKSVQKDGRAAAMGVEPGDVLKKVAGRDLESLREIFQFAREVEGDTVTFTFQRGARTFEAGAKKGDLPAPRQRPERGGDGAPRDGGTPASGSGSSGGGER